MSTLVADPRIARPSRRTGVRWVVPAAVVVVLVAAAVGIVIWGSTPSGNVLAASLSQPLDGVTNAKVNINSDTGHLTIDRLTGNEQMLATGTLQYFEHQGLPSQYLSSSGSQANLSLSGGGTGQSWFRMPWSACGGAYEWQVHLNPNVQSDITAYSGGGNVRLNLAGMAVTGVMAETGGGNMDVVLPEKAANLTVTARTGGGNVTVDVGNGITGRSSVNANSGAGNVEVRVPKGITVKVHATSGLGKVLVDPGFSKVDGNTYQSPDYADAANKIEITVNSGAGDVSVKTK